MRILIFFVLSLLLTGCDSKPDAPFGFKWGESVDEVLALNLDKAKLTGDKEFTQFLVADDAPQPIQYSGHYHLTLTTDLGLTSIRFSKGVDETSDFFNEGRTIYNDIAKKLEEKYGKPLSVNENVKEDGAEFYVCIREESCGKWERNFKHDEMTVRLSVKPVPGRIISGLSKGYVTIDYEYLTKDMIDRVRKKYQDRESSNNF